MCRTGATCGNEVSGGKSEGGPAPARTAACPGAGGCGSRGAVAERLRAPRDPGPAVRCHARGGRARGAAGRGPLLPRRPGLGSGGGFPGLPLRRGDRGAGWQAVGGGAARSCPRPGGDRPRRAGAPGRGGADLPLLPRGRRSGGAGAGRHARRRGFLRAALAAERARALLAALPEPSPAPSAAGLLGEARTRKLWTEAVSWPGWRRVFCGQHGIVPSAPSSDGTRCYLGCTIPTSPEAA